MKCNKMIKKIFDMDEIDVKEPASKESDIVERESLTIDLKRSKDSNVAGLLGLKIIFGRDAG